MQRLCRITVPGLSIESDFTPARQRMLANFPDVHDVLATTAPGTLLVVYSGPDETDAWYKALLESIATRRARNPRRLLRRRCEGLGGGDSAA